MLDREMEDERDEDPGFDLSTDEYDSGEEAADELADEIDEGIVIECPTERNRLVKVLGVQELRRSHTVYSAVEVILKLQERLDH